MEQSTWLASPTLHPVLAAFWFAFSPIEERRRQEGEEDGSFTCSAFTTHSLRPLFCRAELRCASDADAGLAFVTAALGAPALQRAALPGQRTRGGGPAALVSLFASFNGKHSHVCHLSSFWVFITHIYIAGQCTHRFIVLGTPAAPARSIVRAWATVLNAWGPCAHDRLLGPRWFWLSKSLLPTADASKSFARKQSMPNISRAVTRRSFKI